MGNLNGRKDRIYKLTIRATPTSRRIGLAVTPPKICTLNQPTAHSLMQNMY